MKRRVSLAKKAKARRRGHADYATLSLFIVLFGLFALGRMLQVRIIQFEYCNDLLFRGPAAPGLNPSAIEWFLIIPLLAVGFQLAASVNALSRGAFRWHYGALGALNILMAIAFFLSWLMMWFSWHPGHPAAKALTGPLVHAFKPKLFYWEGGFPQEPAPDPRIWTRVETAEGEIEFVHISTGVVRRKEVVFQCQPEAINDLQAKLWMPYYDFGDDPGYNTRQSWVHRDRHGELMSVRDWLYYDAVGLKYRAELEQSTPELSYEEFTNITDRQWTSYHAIDNGLPFPGLRRAKRESISLEEFTELYVCNLDQQGVTEEECR